MPADFTLAKTARVAHRITLRDGPRPRQLTSPAKPPIGALRLSVAVPLPIEFQRRRTRRRGPGAVGIH